MTERIQKMPYLNRELSWMDFNARVLEEAMERENPLMDRLNFLSITASNLDEFYMVRVAGVMEQIHSKYTKRDASGLTPQELLEELTAKIHAFTKRQYSCLHRSILPALRRNGITFLHMDELDEDQAFFAKRYFKKILFPVLTPLAVDTSRPFPQLANKSLNVAVRLKGEEHEEKFAIVQVPSILPRFLELPAAEGRAYLMLEELIAGHLPELFELHKIKAACPFRITRNADLDIDEDSEDLMREIEKSIKKRKRGRPVRLELLEPCDKEIRAFLVDALDVGKREIYKVPGPIDLTFFTKFAALPDYERLRFEPVRPVDPPADFWGREDIFEAIREKDRMVHHPYESFNVVVRFVKQAAEDPEVLAIKQTLYRVSGKSPIVEALIRAAENGKQVTVLVELKARFDEENNINWAKKLERAGCHVIYGLTGLKTHCKILLVVRREEDGIRRYLHMGTGNYNDSTARFYTDVGMFTCKESFGMDASSLFNVLTGYSRPPEYNKMIVAPRGMRSFFERMIQKETENAKNGLPSGITVKVNSLVDSRIIALLYEASGAGVPVRLLVRGICCLIPGLPQVSENITVRSIVGQLLEHSRIFRFENGGNPRIYMGSTDWMPRNLDRRVELVFPVEEKDLRERAFAMLELMMEDTVNARVELPDTSYQHIDKRGKAVIRSQAQFARMAREAVEALEKEEEEKPYRPRKSPEGNQGTEQEKGREE